MALSTHEELILLRKRARRRLVGAVVLVTVATVVLWNVVGRLPEQQMKPESIEVLGAGASAPAANHAEAPAGTVPPPAQPASAPSAASSALAEAAPATKPGATELAANLSTMTPAMPAAQPAPALKPEPKPEARPEPKAEAKPKPEHKPEPKPAKPKHKKPEIKLDEKPARKPDPAAILEGRFDSLDKPAAKKEEPAAKAEGKSVIQLAALSDPEKADALKSKLSSIGVAAHFSKVQTSKGEVTRVRVGPFNSRAEAQATLQKLAKAGVNGIIVTK
ncbi:DedD protein [Chromobacterium alkanivorans]|uniref:SPOR domain-containing protein n=1 Tax=Chromobacterium alkanivorans TaxID=1071719 RepID=UPI002167C061|nr:SPOR domain-containing protein [Chromobacterium alkanivorans]MCS3803988.1 DedD protein [Chromobacterium alkanivorans]MCS3817907.1 DedD protein [Chromobacterium alkanivorans]MCS3875527.1 DedD protein [Chromobacterium alkanivorans]